MHWLRRSPKNQYPTTRGPAVAWGASRTQRLAVHLSKPRVLVALFFAEILSGHNIQNVKAPMRIPTNFLGIKRRYCTVGTVCVWQYRARGCLESRKRKHFGGNLSNTRRLKIIGEIYHFCMSCIACKCVVKDLQSGPWSHRHNWNMPSHGYKGGQATFARDEEGLERHDFSPSCAVYGNSAR